MARVHHQWRALIVAIAWLSATLIPLNGVPILLPSIATDFDRSTSATAWVMLAYSLAMAGAFMPASHVGDLLGHKRVALFGSYLEISLLLLIVVAPNLETLVALRLGQGVAHSLAVPNFTAFAVGGFPPERRGRAAGMMGGAVGLSMLIVPVLVGVITDSLGWRWVFGIAAALILVITLVGSFALREQDAPRRPRPSVRQFDIPGAVLLMASVAPLIVGAQLLRRSDTAWPWLLFAVAAVLFTAFLYLQSRLAYSTLPVRVLRRVALLVPTLHNLAVQFSQGVANYLLPVFFIQGLDWTATYAGAVMVGMAAGRAPGSFLGGYLADRIGGIPVMLLGSLGLVASLTGLAMAGAGGSLWGLLPFMLLFGLTHNIVGTGLQKQMFSEVPQDQLGIAPGVLGLGRHLGQAIGIGIAAAIFSLSVGDAPTGTDPSGAAEGFRAALIVTAAVVGLAVVATSVTGRASAAKRRQPAVPPVERT